MKNPNHPFIIEYDKFNDWWYVKSAFGKILKSLDNQKEAEEWLKRHKQDIQNELLR